MATFGSNSNIHQCYQYSVNLLKLLARTFLKDAVDLPPQHSFVSLFGSIRKNVAGVVRSAFARDVMTSNEGRFSPRSSWPRYFGFNRAASANFSCVNLADFLAARRRLPKSLG